MFCDQVITTGLSEWSYEQEILSISSRDGPLGHPLSISNLQAVQTVSMETRVKGMCIIFRLWNPCEKYVHNLFHKRSREKSSRMKHDMQITPVLIARNTWAYCSFSSKISKARQTARILPFSGQAPTQCASWREDGQSELTVRWFARSVAVVLKGKSLFRIWAPFIRQCYKLWRSRLKWRELFCKPQFCRTTPHWHTNVCLYGLSFASLAL